MSEWASFYELMESEQVAALVRDFCKPPVEHQSMLTEAPPFIDKFMALTMLCSAAEPDQDIRVAGEDLYAAGGVCVFYVRPEDHEGGLLTGLEPWTCLMTLGESLSYTFQSLHDSKQLFNEDDGWTVPTNGAPSDLDLGWQPTTLAMLGRSVWRPLRTSQDVVQARSAPQAG